MSKTRPPIRTMAQPRNDGSWQDPRRRTRIRGTCRKQMDQHRLSRAAGASRVEQTSSRSNCGLQRTSDRQGPPMTRTWESSRNTQQNLSKYLLRIISMQIPVEQCHQVNLHTKVLEDTLGMQTAAQHDTSRWNMTRPSLLRTSQSTPRITNGEALAYR